MTFTRPIKPQPAIYALESLHAELAGKIADNKRDADRLTEAMKHVEAVLKMLQPGYDVRPIAVRRRKPNPWFKRGTIFRHVLDVLRDAQGPMTARQITVAMLQEARVGKPDPKDVRAFVTSVQTCLQSNNGRTVKNVAEGMPGRWAIPA
jgi:hypothetical protein